MRIKWSEFQPLTNNNAAAIPLHAGVYLLWCKLARDEWRCYYVGATTSLQAAIRQHLSVRETNLPLRRKIANCITGIEYSIQPDPEVRAGVAQFLIQHYKPELKVTLEDPSVEPIDVNLPAAKQNVGYG